MEGKDTMERRLDRQTLLKLAAAGGAAGVVGGRAGVADGMRAFWAGCA